MIRLYCLFCFFVMILLFGMVSYGNHHYDPEKQASFQLYTQLYYNKFIFGFCVKSMIMQSVFVNSRFVFFNAYHPGVVIGLYIGDVGYDRKLWGFKGPKNRFYVDVYD